MTRNVEGVDGPPIERIVADRRREVAKLAGVVVFSLASLAVVFSAVWSTRGDRPARTVAQRERRPDAVKSSDDQPLLRGREIFQARCVRCHGDLGHGDGPEMVNAAVRLRDLGSASWRSGAARDAVRRVVAEGIPATTMPASGRELSARELDWVVDYVLTLEIADLMPRVGLSLDTGRIAPRLLFRDTLGTVGSLEQYRGKFALIAFWGTTCAPCMRELPELEQLAANYEKGGLVVLPVCVDETDATKVRDVASRVAPRLAVYVDSDGSARDGYFVRHLPQAFLVDRDGRVLGRSYGNHPWVGKEVERLLTALLRMPSAVASDDDDEL